MNFKEFFHLRATGDKLSNILQGYNCILFTTTIALVMWQSTLAKISQMAEKLQRCNFKLLKGGNEI